MVWAPVAHFFDDSAQRDPRSGRDVSHHGHDDQPEQRFVFGFHVLVHVFLGAALCGSWAEAGKFASITLQHAFHSLVKDADAS